MSRKPLISVDFETKKSGKRPHEYPPEPVGVALWNGRNAAEYLAWGHPTGNNCTKADARRRLKDVWKNYEMVFHNGPFDLEVGEKHLDLPWPDWRDWHCTMILAFLYNPHAISLELKQLADKLLGMPPDEQTRLYEWLKMNVPAVRKKPSLAGAHISLAPAPIVAPYAKGDVRRTFKLYRFLWNDIGKDPHMPGAYELEKRVAPMLAAMERRGVPVAEKRLREGLVQWRGDLIKVEDTIKRRLGLRKRDSDWEAIKFTGDKFADLLEASGAVDPDDWILTDKGNRQTGKDVLPLVCGDKKLTDLLTVRNQLQTCIGTFGENWLAQAEEANGLIHFHFNQVRQANSQGKGLVGARTGRLSSTPNMQNVIRSDKDARVPKLRDFIVPRGKGHRLWARDYTQQELRILAHFEDGSFLEMYKDTPTIDAHDAARALVRQLTGMDYPRRSIKDVAFGLLYGMGIGKTADKLGVEPKEAKAVRTAYLAALPGVKALIQDLKRRAENNEPIYTWGGRRYYCEPAKLVKGRWRTFDYKLINVLIQGSAADATKRAMLNIWDAMGGENGSVGDLVWGETFDVLLQVHDELIGGVSDKRLEKPAHELVRDCMADLEFDVAMLSDGKSGGVSWHRMKSVKW